MKESKTARVWALSLNGFSSLMCCLITLARKCSMATTVQGVFLPIETVFHQMRRIKKSNTRAKCPECERLRDIVMSSPQAYSSHDTSYFFCSFAVVLLLFCFCCSAGAFASVFAAAFLKLLLLLLLLVLLLFAAVFTAVSAAASAAFAALLHVAVVASACAAALFLLLFLLLLLQLLLLLFICCFCFCCCCC